MKNIILLFLILCVKGECQQIEWNSPIQAGYRCNSFLIDTMGYYYSGTIWNGHEYYFNNLPLPDPYPNFSYGYLIKTDFNNNVQWAQFSMSKNISSSKSTIDREGNVVIAARFSVFFQYEDEIVHAPSEQSYWIVLYKINKDGSLVWTNIIEGGSWVTTVTAITTDQDNNIYLGGNFADMIAFYNNNNRDTIVDQTNARMFFAEYNSDGIFQWVKTMPEGINQSNLNALILDEDRNFYLTGYWYGEGTFDSIPKISSSDDIFIAKYNYDRQIQWLKQIGTPSNTIIETGNALAIDYNLKQLYATGAFLGTADFGGGNLAANDRNIFLACYDFDGTLSWVKNMGCWSGLASYTEQGQELYIDKDGFVFLTGTLGINGYFDGIQMSAYFDPSFSNRYFDSFIAKFKPTGDIIWADHLGHPGADDDLFSLAKHNNILTVVGSAKPNSIFGNYILAGEAPYRVGYVCQINDYQYDMLEVRPGLISLDDDLNLSAIFRIMSNQDWNVTIDSDWLSLSTSTGSGNMIITLSANPNHSTLSRSSILQISASGMQPLQLYVTQLPAGTGITESTKNTNSFSIYPNPSYDYINLIFNNDYIVEKMVTIHDLSGKELYRQYYDGNKISIRQLRAGMYFVVIESNHLKSVNKFLKID